MNDRFLPGPGNGNALIARESGSALARPNGSTFASDDQSFDPKPYIAALVRWRWLFLSIVASTVIAAGVWLSLQTPLYRATATLELNPDPSQVVQTDEQQNQQDHVQGDRDFLALQLGLIHSRSLAENVARSLNLAHDAAFLRRDPTPGAGPTPAPLAP